MELVVKQPLTGPLATSNRRIAVQYTAGDSQYIIYQYTLTNY